jgi:hypothetical protein
MLNFFRRATQEYLVQLGDSRMMAAKMQSKLAVGNERVKNMKEMFSLERVSKQKSVMKYIREQMRISDLRKVIGEISTRAQESLDELDVRRRDIQNSFVPTAGAQIPDNRYMKDLLKQLVGIAEQLAVSTKLHSDENVNSTESDVSKPVGALEIRLPESQVDDETLHGVIGLLCGALGPAAAANAAIENPYDPTASYALGGLEDSYLPKSQMSLLSSGLDISAAGV